MSTKKILKKIWFARETHRKISVLIRNLSALGVWPFRILRASKIPRYFTEMKSFKSKGGKISHFYPILSDYRDTAGTANGHYFHQDLLVAQYIHESSPERHVDIGSRIDGFVAHVAAFRKIEILDIRELHDVSHLNIQYKKADLTDNAELEITDSISCLHAIEHFGLGRYGDQIKPDGYLLGWENLIRMLQPGGKLYISFPIGIRNEVHFNAHRVFHPRDIFSWSPDKVRLLKFDYVDDKGNLNRDFDVMNQDLKVTYGCGIYTFIKI